MAVPTIATVSPSTGAPTGGQLVEIIGTGFRQVPPPPPNGPVPEHPPTVSVLFGAFDSPRVAVVSETRLLVVVPRAVMPTSAGVTLGELNVDITVRNMADDGTPIPGEQVVLVDAYAYVRPDVSTASESALASLCRALMHVLKGEVLPNVVFSVHTDYDHDVATAVVDPAELPAIVMVGPAMTTNTLYSDNARPTLNLEVDGERLVGRRPLYMDLSFDLIVITKSDMQLLNLVELITVVVDRISSFQLVFPPPAGVVELDINWTSPMKVTKQAGQLNSNLRLARGTFTVVGFPFSTIVGVDLDAAQDVAAVLLTAPDLQPPQQFSDNPPT